MVSLSVRTTTQSALLALAVATSCATGAQAKDLPGGFIQPGQATAAPRGFVEMCESGVEPGFCSPTRPIVAGAALITAGLSDRATRDAAGPVGMVVPVLSIVTPVALPVLRPRPDCLDTPTDPRLEVSRGLTAPLTPPLAPNVECSARVFAETGASWQRFTPPALVAAVAWRKDGPSLTTGSRDMIAPRTVNAALWVQDGPCTPSAVASMLLSMTTQLCSFSLPDAPPPVVQPPTAEAKPTALPESALKALLKQVNHHVNSRVRQRTDAEIYGVGELWRRSGDGKGAVGDCEDLAIEKRAELIDGGFPPDRLAFAVVYSRASGLHTVLVARTDVEDVVLDGRSPYVVGWTKAPYSWLSVQSMHDPMLWYAPDRAQTA
ncbi:transglutaminase-like cysteine peptidase [Sphingomonas sp. CFBP8993]|uniref:transglutaminase-like cysteine peptidase n=1 Tax=Sphingomonas sp. CFBP8993 TaxID=3096526 RepID=UPI002A6ADBB5|nr:transglutaminase-like cysteine peptidase [Sphingomonas sp. CFBP8993]MDY0957281.1 transglutaminase-like cysteine peptidase [Sphingomonas sp. CFBP8993]